MDEIYEKCPLKVQDGIPVFSETDSYVDNYTTIAKDHLQSLHEHGCNPFIKEHLWQEIERSTEIHIRSRLQPGFKILDVGVGMGRLLERFSGVDRYGLDISIDYLLEAQSRGIQTCLSKIEDMPYRPEVFDLIVTTDVLEHVFDLNLALQKILYPLKIGGILIVRVPYQEDLSSYLSEDCPYDLVHLRTFDKYGLRLTMEKIFRHETLDYSLTGYTGGRTRIPLPVQFKIRGGVERLLNLSRFLGPRAQLTFSKLLRKPTEINFVFRKSGAHLQ